MRDIVLEETVFFDFTTRAFSSGVPTVLAGTPVLSVLEENNATPITDGVSISVDRASVVGLNMATVVATAANGYENGKGYSVYISTGTVGGVSVIGEKVAEFTIGASAAAQDLANGTDGLTALKTGIDAIPTTAMRGTDNAALASVCTETRLQALTDWLDGGRLDLLLDAIPTTAMRGTDNAATAVALVAVGLNVLAIQGVGFVQGTDALDKVADKLDAIPTTPMRGTDSALLAADINLTAGAVDNVTTVATTTTNTDMRGTDSALLAVNINLTGGAVDNVTLVATTTTNTDMRGTDSANTVVPDNTSIAAILVDTSTTLPALIDDLAIKKNTAFNNFEFLMVLTSDGRTPATGLTVTGQRSIDGGAFASVGGAIAEVSNGIYQFDALAADTNGDVITWRFLSATADDTFVTFKTVA